MTLDPNDDLDIPIFLRRTATPSAPAGDNDDGGNMAELPGQNTVSGELLTTFILRLENLQGQKDDITEDMKVVMQEAKSAGFVPETIRHCLKVRKMKPHDREEKESMQEMYLHALGMDHEPSLFRALAAAGKDKMIHSKVIEALKPFVPEKGDFIFRVGSQPKRLWRDKDGVVHVEDWNEDEAQLPTRGTTGTVVPPTSREVPKCTDDEAEQLGREAQKKNEPIISNPFPFGDARRARFDKGWCDASGSDGMGPQESEEGDEPSDNNNDEGDGDFVNEDDQD